MCRSSGSTPSSGLERAAEDVVEAAELPRALDGHDVERLLDDAEQRAGRGAVSAQMVQSSPSARLKQRRAEADLLLDLDDGRRQAAGSRPAAAGACGR